MTRRLAAVLPLALLAAAAASAPQRAREAGPGPPAGRVPPTRADFDLFEIRDIFRYGDEPAPEPTDGPGRSPDVMSRDDASPMEGARLVGLVRRSDRLVAALSIDGQVVLLGAGQSAGGFTVLDVSLEAVRLRDPGGEEATLELP